MRPQSNDLEMCLRASLIFGVESVKVAESRDLNTPVPHGKQTRFEKEKAYEKKNSRKGSCPVRYKQQEPNAKLGLP